MKTKATQAGKVGGNYPAGAPIGDTSRSRVGGQMPNVAPLPGMGESLPWLTGNASASMPSTQATETLPIFNQVPGNTDTGVGHSGDLGGAGA